MLNIEFKDHITIHKFSIEFIDNPFVNKFVEKLNSHISSKCNVSSTIFPSKALEWDTLEVNKLTQELRDTISTTEKVSGIKFPIEIHSINFVNKSSSERSLLNFIHRAFTNFFKSNWTSWSGEDLGFNNEADPKLLRELLQEINEGVHRIEPYFYYDNDRYSIMQHSELVFSFTDNDYIEIEDSDFKYKSSDHNADIWLPISCMLGKNILSCYLDYDDPSEFDIVNENLYNGDFVFGNRSNLINSDMISWLESYKVPKMYGMPLGYVVENKNKLFSILDSFNDIYAGVKNPYTLQKIYLD